MDVTIILSKGSIVLRAKDDTYLAVRSYLSGHEANAKAKYEMQADERATHERKLLNSISSAVSILKSNLSRYRISDTLNESTDAFTLTFDVSDRTDSSRRKDVQRLVEEYIYKRVVAEWWMVNYPDSASPYIVSADTILNDLKKSLSLLPPYESIGGTKYKCLTRRDYRVVLIYKEELLNEIHSELLKLSRIRSDENGLADANLQTNEIYDESLLTRYINRYVGRTCERISAYLYELSNTVDNDMVDRQPVYEFKLVMPDNWDGRLFEQLAEEIHSYIVNSCVYEWLKVYIPQAASTYMMDSQLSYDNIKHVVTTRKRGTLYKPLQPF